jgi:hypothetical protein
MLNDHFEVLKQKFAGSFPSLEFGWYNGQDRVVGDVMYGNTGVFIKFLPLKNLEVSNTRRRLRTARQSVIEIHVLHGQILDDLTNLNNLSNDVMKHFENINVKLSEVPGNESLANSDNDVYLLSRFILENVIPPSGIEIITKYVLQFKSDVVICDGIKQVKLPSTIKPVINA